MPIRFYLSEVSPWWSLDRQREALDTPPGALIFCDRLDRRERRARRAESLAERAAMLRPGRRAATSGEIRVASLAVLAWSASDLQDVLNTIERLGAKLLSATDDEISVEAWRAARDKAKHAGLQVTGSAVSAAKRRAATEAALDEHVTPFWHLPSKDYPTALLLAASGLSLNTVKSRLGPRPPAQWLHQQALSRRKKRER